MIQHIVPTTAAQLVEAFRLQPIEFPRDFELRDAIAEAAEQIPVRLDPTEAFGPNNRDEQDLVLVVGETGAGKSFSVKEALKATADPLNPEGTLIARTISVKLPSPYSSKELARRVLQKLGLVLPEGLKASESELWGMVIHHMERKGTLVLHLDEFQRWKTERGVAGNNLQQVSITRLAESLNDLLVNAHWPVMLIISGLPENLDFWNLEVMEQIHRRTKIVEFQQMQLSYRESMELALTKYTGVAGIRINFNTKQVARRLIRASRETVGIALEMIQEAVLIAFRREGEVKVLEIDDFARVFTKRNGGTGDQNPFLAGDWKTLVLPEKLKLSEFAKRHGTRETSEGNGGRAA